jgi:hypothetical protein
MSDVAISRLWKAVDKEKIEPFVVGPTGGVPLSPEMSREYLLFAVQEVRTLTSCDLEIPTTRVCEMVWV